MGNPYYTMAAIIAAGLNGIDNKMDLPEPTLNDPQPP